MFDLYLTDAFVPFTIALALLFGLLALELLLLIVGSSLLGMGADAEIDVDIDTPDLGDLDIDFGSIDIADFEIADVGADAEVDLDLDVESGPGTGTEAVGPAAWLGIGKMPILIWVAAVLMAFGLVGIVLQQTLLGTFGFALPAVVAVLPAGIVAILFAARFGNFFARVLPKTESTALSERHLGRRTGTVTQGTARRGSPAEVRVSDRHGNLHHLRAEPLKDEDVIPAGTDVLVLRHRHTQGYRLVPLGT